MNRRQFLQTTAQMGIGMGLMANGAAELSATEKAGNWRPAGSGRFYVWTGIDSKATARSLKTKYTSLKSHGIDGVFLGGGIDQREFEAVRAAGLELHTWMWTTNRGEQWIRDNHPDWYMVSRTGKSCFDHPPYVDYYRWISPVIPAVQRYLEDKVAELASQAAVTGVHLDYVRYPDIVLPRALWSKYGVDETNELPEYDFCYSDHTRAAFKKTSGRDPLQIQDPAHDQEWLHFRYNSVTHLVEKLTRVAHGHGKQITAAVFPTPRLARKICRQDWDKWHLDAYCPMIYHSFYDEEIDWIGEMVLENIHAVEEPIHAGLYMPDLNDPDQFRRALNLAKENGAVGASLFGGVSDKLWSVFEDFRASS